MIAYHNGTYLDEKEVRISPDDRGFLFSDGLYEVIRSYGGRLFEARAHMERLHYGARALRFPEAELETLEEVAGELIQKNALIDGDATVYIQVTRGVAPRTHRFPPKDTPLTVFASARPFTPHVDEMARGIEVIQVPDQRWARCDIKSVGLLPNVLAHQQAVDAGAPEALFIRDGFLTEGTHSNLFAIFAGRVVTPPRTNYILGGVTRGVVLDLCRERGIPAREDVLLASEIACADELMIAGTTVEITPVLRILNGGFRSHGPGPVTRRLQKAFRGRVDAGHH